MKNFRVPPGKKLDLCKWPTRAKPLYSSHKDYKAQLEEAVEALSDQQQLLYAGGRHALLVIFQAMDAAGKDGVIRHVLSGINPQGCRVTSFKHPTPSELAHDFLWRTTASLPERGMIGVFNRSYYEEVLIVRVHPEIYAAEAIAGAPRATPKVWRHRYRSIRDLEQHLHENGTRIVKFFLHLSKDEQKTRFLARLDDPAKNWKVGSADMNERKYWNDYRDAYGQCLAATSTAQAPWYAVPADDKENARLIVARILLETLKELKMSPAKPGALRRKELLALRKTLMAEKSQ